MMDALTNLVQTLSGIVVDDRPELEELLRNVHELSGMLGQARRPAAQHLAIRPDRIARVWPMPPAPATRSDFNAPNGLLVDSWMCAISGRAKQFGMIQYFKDCK